MVRLRLTARRVAATKSVVAIGCATVAGGTWVNWGLGWGLIATGVQAVAYGLLLIDVDQEAP